MQVGIQQDTFQSFRIVLAFFPAVILMMGFFVIVNPDLGILFRMPVAQMWNGLVQQPAMNRPNKALTFFGPQVVAYHMRDP